MSLFTTLVRKLESHLKPFRDEGMIVHTIENPNNTSGYGYLPSGRQNKHVLKDGSYLSEGLSFSASKASTIAYFYHKDKDDNIIKSYPC